MDVTYIHGNLDRTVRRVRGVFEKGFFLNVLCPECNNRYGSIYNTAYADFVHKVRVTSGLKDSRNRELVYLKGVYPARILKQMFLMFLCVQPRTAVTGWQPIREFIQRKNMKLQADALRVYLYKNVSPNGRIAPWIGMGECLTRRPPILLSEITYPPVGIVFSQQPDSRFDQFHDVTEWGQYKFKDRTDLVIALPELAVCTDHPLGFGTARDVAAWIKRSGVVRFIPRPEDASSLTSAGVTLRSEASGQRGTKMSPRRN